MKKSTMKTKQIFAVAAAALACLVATSYADKDTFETIPFNQSTYSSEDPLGVQAIKTLETNLGAGIDGCVKTNHIGDVSIKGRFVQGTNLVEVL